MRSPDELAWRLRQETLNFWLFLRPPAVGGQAYAPLRRLPDPPSLAAPLRASPFLAELERLAAQILAHRFPLLGLEIQTGPEIAWRRDYLHGVESPKRYFRRIPYLDVRRAGDHKLIWELNRHQHLVVLAQAWLGVGNRRYLDEAFLQLESWWRDNPFHRGINWSSALEVGFRALSWIWIYHLAGGEMDDAFRHRFLTALYRHGCHLEWNLSVYFSPNTHLLIEAVALHALGLLFPSFPGAERWRRKGGQLVSAQLDAQVRDDGSHFEQSTYYHVYALDAFLFHAVLEEVPPSFRSRLASMARFLAALLGPSRELPFFGDDDGGRFFHPYGPRNRFARATLATAAALLDLDLPHQPEDVFEQALWWLGPSARPRTAAAKPISQAFPGSGLIVLNHGDLHVIMDAGPFGPGSAGHSHSDTLSLVVRRGREEILIDPGTYTYVAEPDWRDRFRGSAAHNTVRAAGADQAIPAGPFRWHQTPAAELIQFVTGTDHDFADATCSYQSVRHRRRVLLLKGPCLLLVLDEIDSPVPADRLLEQFWHPGESFRILAPDLFQIGTFAFLKVAGCGAVECSEGGDYGWRSPALGLKIPAPVVRATLEGPLPAAFAAALSFYRSVSALQVSRMPDAVRLRIVQESTFDVCFPRQGGWRLLSP
jgi:hypothetical protein